MHDHFKINSSADGPYVQLEIFKVPEYKSRDGLGRIEYVGGSQKMFKPSDLVPWRSACYNYSPNFLVLGGPDVADDASIPNLSLDLYPIMFLFLDGRYFGAIPANNKYLDFGLPVFSHGGEKLNVKTRMDVIEYYCAMLDKQRGTSEARERHDAITSVLVDCIECATKSNDARRAEKAYKAHAAAMVSYINDLDYCERRLIRFTEFPKMWVDELKECGAYLSLVRQYRTIHGDDCKVTSSLVQEASKVLEDYRFDLAKYFVWNETPDGERGWIRSQYEYIKRGK